MMIIKIFNISTREASFWLFNEEQITDNSLILDEGYKV